MALQIPKIGLPQMLKSGYQHHQGLEEAVFRNIAATKELSEMTRTCLGPHGRSKIVVNHLEKMFVTSDASTIMRELDVAHPAAKLVVFAAQQQQEMGDGANLVVVLCGALLAQADALLRMGLHPADLIRGFDVALKLTLKIMPNLAIDTLTEFSLKSLTRIVRPTIAAKQYGYEDILTKLVVEASLETISKNNNFNVDSIRVVKILGASIHDSTVVKGMVFGREPESTLQKATNAKVAIFTSGIDVALTETKGTVLIKNANDMLNFSKGEETHLEACIKELADAGVKVVVSGSTIGELALHFLNRYDMLVVKVLSKFDLRRLCRVTGATALTRFGAPTAEEMGFCGSVEAVELGSDRCTVFKQNDDSTKTATVILRGGTQNFLDDLERAIDCGVSVIKAATTDGRLVSGAGSFEIELARLLSIESGKITGIDQYSVKAFAESLEVVPRTLAENAGFDSNEVVSNLYALHTKGLTNIGVCIEDDKKQFDSFKENVIDLFSVKERAVKLATHAAVTLLSIDQIIMSKQAGGPKVPKQNNDWDED